MECYVLREFFWVKNISCMNTIICYTHFCCQHSHEDSNYFYFLVQHDFIRSSRSQDRKIRIEIKDFIDRARRRRGLSDTDEDFGEGDEFDLAAMIQEEERGDTLVDEAPGATLRRNLTMMQGGDPSPVGM